MLKSAAVIGASYTHTLKYYSCTLAWALNWYFWQDKCDQYIKSSLKLKLHVTRQISHCCLHPLIKLPDLDLLSDTSNMSPTSRWSEERISSELVCRDEVGGAVGWPVRLLSPSSRWSWSKYWISVDSCRERELVFNPYFVRDGSFELRQLSGLEILVLFSFTIG